MLNDNIITGTEGNYQFTDSFKDLIIQKQKDVAVTKQLTAEQMFWNATLQIGKQLLVSFAIGAFIAAIQKGIQAWKDYRDRFVNGMNDAHDAAEKAKADVNSIQAKIDELNEKVKAAGADKISDIVDPAERSKLEATNENLEKQLKLKKQLQETEEKKEHKNAVGVYNTKDETIYKDVDGNYDYTMGMAPDTAGYKATGTEALGYYSEMLDEYTEKYNKLLETTTDENDPKLRLVKEQMDYAADEVSRLSNGLVELQGHLSENSDEYHNITNVLGTATDALSYYNGDIDVSNSKLTELTDKIKELDSASKSYYDTVTTNQKYQKYGNVDNTDRGVIRWNKENLQKYSQFAEENGVTEGSYSTVLGSAKEFNKVGEIAYTPMLQTENGVVPLTSSEIGEYLNDVIQKASKMDGGATPENILKVDAEGITETVAGETTKVQGMIAAVEGQIKDGVALTAADVAAISGYSTQELQDEFGEVSKYVGYSMHDIQKSVEEMGDGTAGAIARIQQQVPNLNKNILAQMLMTEGTGFTEETQKGFEVLYEQMNSLGFDVNAENCKLFATALEKLGYISDTTAEKLAEITKNKDKLEEATTGLKNIQSAYGTLSDAVDEYNKNGYLTVSTLSNLIDLGPEYYDCLVDESGQLAINTENINTMADAYYEMAKAALYAQAIESLNANTNTYANASKFLSQAQQEVKDMKSLLYAHGQELIDKGGLTGDALATQVKAQQKVINTYSAMIDLLDKTHAQSTKNQFREPKNNSSSKSSKDNTTDPVSAWKTMTTAMEEYNQQGALCVSTLISLMGLEDKYTALLNVQNGQMEISTSEFKNLMLAEIAQANASDDSGKSAAEFKKILEWVDGNVKENTISYWQLVAAIEGYSAALEKAKGITDTFKDAWSNGKTVKEKIEKSRAGALDYEGTEAQSSALQDLMKYSEYDSELISKAFNKETGKIDLSGDMLKTAVAESLKQQAEAARTEGGEAAEAIAASYEKSAYNIENDVISVQDYFDGLGSTIEEVSSKIDELQSAWSDLGDVTNEYNTYGGLSVDSIQKLLTMSPEYLQFLKMDGDQLVFNRDAMLAYAKANLLTKAAELELKDETKDQAEILRALANSLDKGADSMDGMGSSAEKLKSIFSDMKDLFSSFLDLIESANSKKDNDLKLWGEAMTEDIDKRIDALNKQKEALQEANDEEERAITLAKLKAELEKARTQRTVRKLTSNGYEWVADESAVKEAQDNLNDQQREWNQEDAEKAIDDQIDKLNELKDKYSEIISLIGTDWDDYNKKLKYASEIADMTFTEMEGRVDVFKGNVLASMQAANPISSIKAVISNIESLISTLEKVGDVWDKLEGGNGGGGLTGLWNKITNLFGKSGTDGNIQNIFQKGYNSLKNITSNFFGKSDGSGITGLFKNGLNTLVDGAKSLFNANNVNSLTTIFSNGLSEIGSLFSNTFKGFGKVFSSASGGTGIFSGIGKFFKGIGTALGIGGGAVALSSVPTMTAANTAGMTGLAGMMAKGAISAGAVGTGGALAGGTALGGLSTIPVIGAIIGGVGIGIGNAVNSFKRQKEIWSSNDSTGTKIVKSVGKILWDISPVGMLVNSVKTIGGWVKKIFGIQDKKSQTGANSASANGKINVGDIVINSPDKPASAEKQAQQQQQQTDTRSPWKRFWDNFWGSKFWFWNWGKKASGSKYIEESAPYNVDEQGSELIVRKPESGRYTYLETGDGVVPADITSKLFEMGGNPDKWFNDQLTKHSALSNIQNHTVEGDITVGDIYIQNPVGDTDTLAKEIIRDLPIKLRQERGRR